MQIYYNEINSEIILNKKGFDEETFSNHGFFNEAYPLGYLLVEFIELDFDKIIKMAEDKLNLPEPKLKELIPTHILNIREFYEHLKNIHPYFWDYHFEFKERLEWYEIHLISKINYEEILSHDENWFSKDENIDYIIDMDDSHTNTYALMLKNKLLSLEKFKERLNFVIKYELPYKEFREWDLIGSLKSFINECKEICEKYKKAIEFCIDKENSKEFITLSALQRYYLYYLKVDNEIRHNSLGTTYSINSIDDESNCSFDDTKEYTNEELIKLLPQEPITLYEVYEVNVKTACYFELIKLISKDKLISRCSNCNKYFINTGRADTLYCDRPIDDEEKTCKEVGAMNLYREKTKNDPIMDEYNKIYKRNNARVRYKKMSKNDFFVWSEKARKIRDKARLGEITLEEFKQRID